MSVDRNMGAVDCPAKTRRVMLYFGSFNPVHRAHVAIAEYVVEQGFADEVVLVVSPHNPFKEAADLAPEMERFEGVERAVAASRFPDRIKASAVEFLLPRPSYTIDTLRFLEAECPGVEFSILVGGDNAAELGEWKESEAILARYPIFVYPRGPVRGGDDMPVRGGDDMSEVVVAPNFGASSIDALSDSTFCVPPLPLHTVVDVTSASPHPPKGGGRTSFAEARNSEINAARITVLTDAPRMDVSSTEIRALLAAGRENYRKGDFGAAANDFARVSELAPTNAEAAGYQTLIGDILAFRNTDLLNP